jgi:hypothetical protein
MPITVTITADELKALLTERDAACALREEKEALCGALRLVTVERDLAQERLRAYRRELFSAKSEARGDNQLGLFNEAEVLGKNSAPAREDIPESTVAAHKRKKRGKRKPLDPSLPREVVRHELPEAERFCANDGHALVEFGVEVSEQLDVIPEQLRVIQHQRVKYACPSAIWASRSRRHRRASLRVGCLPNRRSRGLPPASISSACPCRGSAGIREIFAKNGLTH